jgi:hypothetical protein
MEAVTVADGPVTMSSLCESPTRKKWNVPLCTPTDIFRPTLPPEVSIRPISRRARRMSTAARQALAGWSSPVNSRSSASPPNLIRPPPLP